DEEQGRDKSLGASLNYGFHSAFNENELRIIALLSMFQGIVDADVIQQMGVVNESFQSHLLNMDRAQLIDLSMRAKDTGLLPHLGVSLFIIHPALPWFLRRLFMRYYDGQEGRPQAQDVLRTWVAAVSNLAAYYINEFYQNNRGVINLL